MGHQSPGVDFALIGHQDSWGKVFNFVNALRDEYAQSGLPEEKIKETYRYIPPRALFDIEVHSTRGKTVRGIYIETFISPDELSPRYLYSNIKKVKEACDCAVSNKAKIVSLGGFTSIILETSGAELTFSEDSVFTTGNTLTASFIVKGIEKACSFWNIDFRNSRVLIVGSTGDIGSACVTYFSRKVKKLLLCARRLAPLARQGYFLSKQNIYNAFSTDINPLLPQADIVICVASSILQPCHLSLLKADAIICDAGYPKNIQNMQDDKQSAKRFFFGGMGEVQGGYNFSEGFPRLVYHFPVENISHGCLLESIVLAMEEKYEAFSKGRGNITVQAMDDISRMARKHGIILSPLFDEKGCVERSCTYV